MFYFDFIFQELETYRTNFSWRNTYHRLFWINCNHANESGIQLHTMELKPE